LGAYESSEESSDEDKGLLFAPMAPEPDINEELKRFMAELNQ
jgi:hypothetical protein